MARASWAGAAAVLLIACQSHESPQQAQTRMEQESQAFTAVATVTAKRYSGWVAAGQADSIADIFTEQGREMFPNEPAAVGRAAIRMNEARSAATMTSKLVIRGESYMASGPLGIERGSFTFEGRAKPGAPKGMPAVITDDGKYLIHWHNVNGQWRIVELIYNSNRPMIGPRAAKKKPAAHTPAKATTKSKKKK